MLKLSRANIQPQQTDASRVVSSMMPQQYNATPIKTTIEALDLPERVEANTVDTSNIRGFNSNTPPSISSVMKGIIPMDIKDDPEFNSLQDAEIYIDQYGKLRSNNKYLNTVMDIESYGGKLDAANGNALGAYQFMPKTWLGLGLGYTLADRTDPYKSTEGMKKFTAGNIRTLRAMGIPINYGTVYMAHNQGAGGAKHIMDNLYVPLKANSTDKQWQAIVRNIPEGYTYDPDTFTGMDFYNIYSNKFR